MLLSLLPALALGLSLSDAPTAPRPGSTAVAEPAAATHHLVVRSAHTDCLQLNGEATTSISLDLVEPHIGTAGHDGAYFTTITLPDGSVHFKGAFRLHIQTRGAGTLKIDVCDGEAVLHRGAAPATSGRSTTPGGKAPTKEPRV